MNIQWNGAGGDTFYPKKGLRQGDPISPYLFVLCIDKSSHLILEKVNKGNWESLKVGRKDPSKSHLMFAEDLLLFGKATDKKITCVINVLSKFCAMSGQRISAEKTKIFFSKNTQDHDRRAIINLAF